MDIRIQGVCTTWITTRGFGILTADIDGKPAKFFLHISRMKNGQAPLIGNTIQFGVLSVMEGKLPSAIDAEVVEGGAL
jgi:hypothetical protein